ncbi:GCG_CRPN prefix-to-repeats domain-containing protein [Bradyrhizobium sp. HKCCYLS20291]|uniref:GCG_CRPN prefix-to-repeats domain-containing protein n=1 Tax=Bradyrhizobium sp. HKCCYLS20291 TaxID=3420766 RepID=UPI003EB9E7BA
MRTIIASALLLGALTAGASAMPLAPIIAGSQPAVIKIAGGCGPGWHRGPYGGCLRNYANPAAHACPRGFHIGPGGRCRGNGR